MVEDFNNVQDQNLVDDDIASQIAGDSNQAAGSVVHPDDPQPASQKPPAPSAQELLGDKIEQMAAQSENEGNAKAQQPKTEEQPTEQTETTEAAESVAEPQVELPEPEISPAEDEQPEQQPADDEPEENFIPAPDDAPPADDSSDDPDEPPADEAQDEPASNEEEPKEETKPEPKDKPADTDDGPKLDTSHLEGGSGDDDELAEVKQEALEELSPLLTHLDLPADQKFDTFMEILRASDDKTLVKPALEAAREIEDDDKRAQALLDVVNEVNYLTQSDAE